MKLGGHLGFLKVGEKRQFIVNLEAIDFIEPEEPGTRIYLEAHSFFTDEPFEEVWKAVAVKIEGEEKSPLPPPSFEHFGHKPQAPPEFGGYKGEAE